MALHVSVLSGETVSSAFTLPRGDRPVAFFVASHAGLEWRVAFSPDGGSTFALLRNWDGTGSPWTVFSGAAGGVGIVPEVPVKQGRVETAAATTDTTTVAVVELNRA